MIFKTGCNKKAPPGYTITDGAKELELEMKTWQY